MKEKEKISDYQLELLLSKMADALQAGIISENEVLRFLQGKSTNSPRNLPSIIEVNYFYSLEEMINRSACNWKHSLVKKEYPLWPEELKDQKHFLYAKLFVFDQELESQEAIDAMKRAGCRPATMAEAIAFIDFIRTQAKEQREELRKSLSKAQIISLKTENTTKEMVVTLNLSKVGKIIGWIDLLPFTSKWPAGSQFLGIFE